MRAEALTRRMLFALLSRMEHGQITLAEGGARRTFGDPRAALRATIEIHDPGFYPSLLQGGLGAGTAYIERLWDCDDLVSLTRICALNMPALDRWRARIGPLMQPVQRTLRTLRRNTPERSRAQIAAHYDIGNDFFELMLDETMMYSCAVFESPESSLYDAQLAKLDRVCDRLELTPSDHVLEIGTGWGGFAVHAASRYGCCVTTTTISHEQRDRALARVRQAGLAHRVTVLLQDYRALRGTYDKLVSIEMIEAVGWEYLDVFFERCARLLEPDGAMLLQAITTSHLIHQTERSSMSFINRYIFPGGSLPSQQAMSRSIDGHTDLRVVGLEDITPHYGQTLRCWRKSFDAHREQIAALGYDERFQRMWRLYLCFCEGGFRERRIQDVQMLLAKPAYRAERVEALAARAAPAPRIASAA